MVTVRVAELVPGESPRSDGQSSEHVSRLADMDGPLPPILVNARTMQVIDGTHRLLAAILKGSEEIEAILFEGTPEEAFLWAVQANVSHGLPLSQADRRAAAARIIRSHSHLSDRAIAGVAGLGARTVAAIRRNDDDGNAQVVSRVGRDGRVRPVNGAEGRRRVAELMVAHPDASLREIARRAGVSPATVSDVRRRVAAGDSPVLPDQDAAARGTFLSGAGEPAARVLIQSSAVEPGVGSGVSIRREHPRPRRERLARLIRRDPGYLLRTLVKDPSLRDKEEGRHLLRLLHNAVGVQELPELTAAVPAHCGELVADIAKQYAETWLEFARELDQRSC